MSKTPAALIPTLNLCYRLARKGTFNLPGSTAASKKTTETLLLKDAESHHCFFKASGFHNHLSHHLLAAYDLGAQPGLLKKIYEDEARAQRPILLDEKDSDIVINETTWRQHLGTQAAYKAYVEFFANEIRQIGAAATFRKYIFEEGKDDFMLVRLLSGALHPLIQVGYGAEFGNDTLVATGLAQAAVHQASYAETLLPILNPPPSHAPPSEKTTSLLHLFRKVYDTPALTPPLPYDPNMLFRDRVDGALANGGSEALIELCKSYPIHPTHGTIASHLEQITWVATLLTFATSKPDRKPRLDFFLMHLLTSSLFLRPICDYLLGYNSPSTSATASGHQLPLQGPNDPDTEVLLGMQAELIKAYIPTMLVITLARGRPRIDATTLMKHTAAPRPPTATSIYRLTPTSLNADPTSQAGQEGEGGDGGEYNPWPALLDGVLYHPDSHVLKAMRSLAVAARDYGTVARGDVIGASYTRSHGESGGPASEARPLTTSSGHAADAIDKLKEGEEGKKGFEGGRTETHKGTLEMDGTIFVRAAGVLLDRLGWVAHGRKEGDWDRSALGWEAAWEGED